MYCTAGVFLKINLKLFKMSLKKNLPEKKQTTERFVTFNGARGVRVPADCFQVQLS
jgi:hypothetical protein